jgi:subtilisin-like proprotein convertase family protein
LEGPWISIADFEAPHTSPSTSSSGIWDAKRGDNAFNDTMTYFHIDQNQRYIQSLGFSGERGIQFNSISVDSDGLNGSDNSHFIPHDNQIAFGHGCVDDNEDADVILHEYGHALQFSINNSWQGGDTGAMGEGFGDYWAASYSLSTKNGTSYFPAHVFSWDADRINNHCWPGRILNALEAHYDPDHSYGAHMGIDGGFQSDELWSTPLFQSLLALRERNIPREDVDRIILEAHFGLGAEITMREMAQQIIRTAQELYPLGPHAEVFKLKFSHHNIIENPQALLSTAEIIISNAGTNNSPDPGETIHLSIPLLNQGTLLAPKVHAELSSPTIGVSIIEAHADYNDIAIGEQRINEKPFIITLAPSLSCDAPVELALNLLSEPGIIKEDILKLNLQLGKPWPDPFTFSIQPNVAIPDFDNNGIKSALVIENSGALIKASGLSVDVDIKHSYRGDLKITLISPQGTRVLLHNNGGNSTNNLSGNFPKTLTPYEPFTKLNNEALDGEWRLEVVDTAASDSGTLISWGIRAEFERRCE